MQGCYRFVGLDERRNLAQLRFHPGGHHVGRGPAVRHKSALVAHVQPVAERQVARGQRIGLLFHVGRFARQRRLIYFQRVGFDKAHVGRNDVAGFEHRHVAGHQVGRRDFHRLAVAQHLSLRGSHFLQGFHGFVGPVLLHEADEGIQHHDGQNDVGGLPLTHGPRHCGRHQQHQYHHVGQLVQQQLPHGFLLGVGQYVRAVFGQPLPGSSRVEPGGRGVKRLRDIGKGGGVVVHRAAC